MAPTEDATATEEKEKPQPKKAVKSYIKVRKLMAQSSELHQPYVTSKAVSRAELGVLQQDSAPPPPPPHTHLHTSP